MLDAVRFEELGLPAAAILTEPFRATGQVMAELQGFTDYPFATVPHPVASLTEQQILAVADAVTPTVERLLLSGRPEAPRPVIGQASEARTPAGDGSSAASRTSHVNLEDVVQDLAAALRADRADLMAEQSGNRMIFELHIPDEACAECVMPSSMLVPMLQRRVESELGRGFVVELHDPRDHGGPGVEH